jgi:hypothetical protein
MQIVTERPNGRPRLFLPLALTAPPAGPGKRHGPFPLSPDQLRRTVADMVG